MFTDLVLCKEQLPDLGFDKLLNVNLIEFNTKKELQKKLSQEKGLRIVLGSRNNRTAIESKRIDILLSPERGIKKDSFHHRNSGLDHAICTLAKKSNITIGFNFNEVLTSQGVLRAEKLGRMMQNVRLCRKYKIRMLIGSFAKDKWQMRSRNDLISFGIVLGMHPEEAQKSLQVIKEIGKERREKKFLITEGVRILQK